MKINILQLDFTIKPIEDTNKPDMLAHVSLKFTDEHERHFTVNGFTIRVSKLNQKPYLVPPSKSMGMGRGFFKYTIIDSSLWKEIERDILKEYDYSTIPVI